MSNIWPVIVDVILTGNVIVNIVLLNLYVSVSAKQATVEMFDGKFKILLYIHLAQKLPI